MDIILFILLAIVTTLYILNLLQKKDGGSRKSKYPPASKMPYKSRPLLTKTEYAFYQYLKMACDKTKLIICPKVRLEDIVTVTSKDRRTINKFRGYIRARHLDFVICDEQMKTLCAVELDDPSHNSKKAKSVDQLKDNVCTRIGIKLYRIKTGSNYMEKITEIIQDIYKTNTATRTAASGNTTARTNTANRTTTNNTAARTNAAAANRNYTRTTGTTTNKTTTTGNTPNRTAPTRATTTKNPATRTNSN